MSFVDRMAARFGYVKAAKRKYPRWMREVAAQSAYAITDYQLYENQARSYAQSAWVYVCVSHKAQAAASVPYRVFEMKGEERVEVPNHPLEQILKKPNDKFSGFELMEATVGYLDLCGNAYWYLNPGQGEPLEIWLLRPDRMTIVPDPNEWVKGYVYTVNCVPCPLGRDEVIHFKRWHPLRDYEGLSAIEAAALSIELDNKALIWDTAFFKESAVPSAIVNVGPISDADFEDVKAQWEGKYKGAARSHKTAFVRSSQELGVETIAMPQADMQFLETMKFSREQIFNIFGFHLGLLSENATEANAKVAYQYFYNTTLYPVLRRIGDKISSEILSRWGENLAGEFEDVRIGESKELWLAELQTVQKGAMGPLGMPMPIMTVDEIRERYFDLEPLPVELAAQPIAKPPVREQEEAGEQGSRGAEEQEGEEESEGLKAELRRWREVSLRLANTGRNPAAREFQSEVIPADVRAWIAEGLWEAKTAEEVKAVFAGPFPARRPRPKPLQETEEAFRQRMAWEQKVISGLLAMWAKHAERVIEWLKGHREVKKQITAQAVKAAGDDLAADMDLWEEMAKDYTQLLLPAFEKVMQEAALLAIEGLPFEIGVDWELVNTAAAKWARDYTYDLISGINETTAARLQAAINNWIEAGEDFPALVSRVQEIFSNPVRAEMIAASELTRIYVEANTLAWKESGVVAGRRWVTANDERVCPICGPLGGLTVTTEGVQPAAPGTQTRRAVVADLDKPFIHPLSGEEYTPPAHVNCRCWITPVLL